MRNRLGRALGELAAGVTVITATGMLAAGAVSAVAQHVRPNATQACGSNCLDGSSELLGPNVILNAYIPGDTGTGGKAGQLLTLKFASDSHPNEDFTNYALVNGTPETVADFCDAWPAPQSFNPLSYVCQNMSDDVVIEISWSPFGNENGLCAGVARAGVDGENVTLRDCGESDNTLWIVDEPTCNGSYCPLVNGGDTHFSHPLVMTVNAGSSHPANQVIVARENLLAGGAAQDAQQFRTVPGPVHNGCGPGRPLAARAGRSVTQPVC